MTTPYIEAKKAEAREKMQKYAPRPEGCENCWGDLGKGCTDKCRNGFDLYGAFFKELDSIVDTLLDEIESRVKGKFKCHAFGSVSSHHCPNCDNNMTRSLEAAFQHLRTGVEAE